MPAPIDRLARVVESELARLILSALIVLSVLPERVLGVLLPGWDLREVDLLFFAVFLPELVIRTAIYLHRMRRGEASRTEPLVLALDLLAVASLLPIEVFLTSFTGFRLLRLLRLVLLIGYWSGMLGDLARIFLERERRFQVVFVMVAGLLLSFAGAVLLAELSPIADWSGNYQIGPEDESFLALLWWSFRQVQDPGNLITSPSGFVLVAVSLVLTFAGLLLFSFVIGIGTSAVGEVVGRARSRPVGLRAHTALVGVDAAALPMLRELAAIYRKNRRRLRAAALVEPAIAAEAERDSALSAFRIRAGLPAVGADLDKVDVGGAKRILVLGSEHEDASSISSILATRIRNSRADLFVDLAHESSFPAARAAGGAHTHVIGSGTFLGSYLAKLALHPGCDRLYRELLTPRGCEIYTYLYSPEERVRLGGGASIDPFALWQRGLAEHRTNWIGAFLAPPGSGALEIEDLSVQLGPLVPPPGASTSFAGRHIAAGALQGLIGIAPQWEDVRGAARELIDLRPDGAPNPTGLALAPQPSDLPIERVVVCGGSGRVPRLVRELLIASGRIEATILVRDERRIDELAEDLVDGFAAAGWRAEIVASGGRRTIDVETAGGVSTVAIRHLDWSDLDRLRRQSDVRLGDADAIFLVPRGGASSAEADGLVALTCLEIAHLAGNGVLALREGVRIVGLVRDSLQAELLESRLDAMSARAQRFTVVHGQRLRSDLTVQNIFVRGLSSILLELVSSRGADLYRIRPWPEGQARPAEPVTPLALAAELRAAHGLAFVALESADGKLLVDPAEIAVAPPLAPEAIRAVYVIGDSHRESTSKGESR